jgi:hypothetical protein
MRTLIDEGFDLSLMTIEHPRFAHQGDSVWVLADIGAASHWVPAVQQRWVDIAEQLALGQYIPDTAHLIANLAFRPTRLNYHSASVQESGRSWSEIPLTLDYIWASLHRSRRESIFLGVPPRWQCAKAFPLFGRMVSYLELALEVERRERGNVEVLTCCGDDQREAATLSI